MSCSTPPTIRPVAILPRLFFTKPFALSTKPDNLSLKAATVPTIAAIDAIFASFAFATLVFADSGLFPLRISVWFENLLD